ncbi:hypothetical protein BT96DRAFT_1057800 [Gymnopus androsaceus JB14]|uniref:Uncharacterized protein n=1 Tax=Gymnopus androsaceus JB14 TaxID=1447944 RepID=A0A6A4H3G9_9AGAR|nr:hypothetical protein BT96DRAFT_1057800 [Gymnopus androsaceus JB14]
MTPEESEEIAAAGVVFFQNITSLIFMSGLFGVYILAFIISMRIILQKDNNRWGHKALIALLLVGFVMVALYTCANIANNLVLVKSGLVMSLAGGLIAHEMAANLKSNVTNIIAYWSSTANFLIADITIAWRAWVLSVENRLIRWTLLVILLLDIGINAADTRHPLGVNIADDIADTKVKLGLVIENKDVTLDWVSTVLNLTVNIVGTSLIGCRAWIYHKSTYAILRNKKTQVEAILLLMVESGAIFGMIQFYIYIVLFVMEAGVVLPRCGFMFGNFCERDGDMFLDQNSHGTRIHNITLSPSRKLDTILNYDVESHNTKRILWTDSIPKAGNREAFLRVFFCDEVFAEKLNETSGHITRCVIAAHTGVDIGPGGWQLAGRNEIELEDIGEMTVLFLAAKTSKRNLTEGGGSNGGKMW